MISCKALKIKWVIYSSFINTKQKTKIFAPLTELLLKYFPKKYEVSLKQQLITHTGTIQGGIQSAKFKYLFSILIIPHPSKMSMEVAKLNVKARLLATIFKIAVS
jgi:hypothetical protein